MPLTQTGQVVLTTERTIELVGFSVQKFENKWTAQAEFAILDDNGATIETRTRDFSGSQMSVIKNQLFQADAVDKIYQDFIDNTEFDVTVTGVTNEFEN